MESIMPLNLLLITFTIVFSTSCSTISKKDCHKDMNALGLSQGRAGSPKKYTDELRNKCSSVEPLINLEAYEKGFYQGWMEYCLPHKAYELGKTSDRYISFCPPNKEASFRQKYLVGKHHAELKDVESDIVEKMNSIKSQTSENSSRLNDYTKLQIELEKVKREIQALEVEGSKNDFKFR